MTFQQPLMLVALLAIPALVALYVLVLRRRRQFTLRFTNVELLSKVVGRGPGVRRHIPPVLFLLAATGLLLGLAGPILNLEVARSDASVMLVIDTSGSMQATDVQPTRIDAARNAAHSLIDQLPGSARIGLVHFNGSATLDQPLTDNRDAVASALEGLQPGGATAIGDGILTALHQLVPNPSKATAASSARNQHPPLLIVLLTDGVSNAGTDPQAAAAQAQAAGVPVDTIGIGQRNASVIVHGQDVGGVDEAALQAIAGTTGGKYFFAEAAGQLNQIYASLGSEFAWRFMRVDLTLPLLLLGTATVLAAAGLSLVWFRVLP